MLLGKNDKEAKMKMTVYRMFNIEFTSHSDSGCGLIALYTKTVKG